MTKTWVWNTFGFISLTTGIIAIFIPLIPTTPLLILAAFCFSRGSPHFHAWLYHHPWFGPPIHEWERHHSVRTSVKITATLMCAGSGVTMGVLPQVPLWAIGVYALIIIPMLIYLWTRPAPRGH